MTSVADIFETMAYGPAPEGDAPVREWLERHQLGTFGHFIDGAFTKHGKTFAVNKDGQVIPRANNPTSWLTG